MTLHNEDNLIDPPEDLTIHDVFLRILRLFAQTHSDNPGLEARLLMAAASGLSASDIMSRPQSRLSVSTLQHLNTLVHRRLNHEPIARILGYQDFWSLSFKLNEATLIPRPDTETVVELSLELISDRKAPIRILDLGCGTGCILLSLLTELPNATGVCADLSERALEAAQQNAQMNGINTPKHPRVHFIQSDWASNIQETFDLIVSNPPYILQKDIHNLAPDVRDYDPLLALNGGIDGLKDYHAIFQQVARVMNPEALLILEIGQGQEHDVTVLGKEAGFIQKKARKDYANIQRALAFKRI